MTNDSGDRNAAHSSHDGIREPAPVYQDGRPALGPRHAHPGRPRLSTARAGVLRALMANREPATVTTLAGQLGQHPNTVREHLDALADMGRVERFRSAPSGRGRPAWLYRAAMIPTPAGEGLSTVGLADGSPLGSDGQEYLALAMAIIDQVGDASANPQLLARKAGERWGRALAQQRAVREADTPAPRSDGFDDVGPSLNATGMVMDLLRDLRFESRPSDDPKTMRLTTCPFLDAARHSPGVVCQVHLGIVRGALEQWGTDPDGTQLREFAEPGACLLQFPERR